MVGSAHPIRSMPYIIHAYCWSCCAHKVCDAYAFNTHKIYGITQLVDANRSQFNACENIEFATKTCTLRFRAVPLSSALSPDVRERHVALWCDAASATSVFETKPSTAARSNLLVATKTQSSEGDAADCIGVCVSVCVSWKPVLHNDTRCIIVWMPHAVRLS